MYIRRVTIQRFRGIERLQFCPGACTVILGPNNGGKSTVLEALDLLLYPGLGRPRPAPEESDYFRRDSGAGFEVEAVLGGLPDPLLAELRHYLEGWRGVDGVLVPEPDGEGIEPVVRVRLTGTSEFEHLHEFAKPEAEGARFYPRFRQHVGWVFDGRSRDPARQLLFYQGGLLERLFADTDLDPALSALRDAIRGGADSVNEDDAVGGVLETLSGDLANLGLLQDGETALFESGSVSRRTLLQALELALPAGQNVQIPLRRQGRGAQRLALVAVLLRLAAGTGLRPIGAFEEPEEALEPLRQAQLADMLRELVEGGGQVFVVTHSPDIARCFGIESFLLLRERDGGAGAKHLSGNLSARVKQAYERRLDGPVVRGLFCRVPVLAEGPGDRSVFETFWAQLARDGVVLPLFRLGLDVINAEGVSHMPMLAAVLDEAGKAVAAWVDQDTDEARREIARLRGDGHCAALMLHDPAAERSSLEGALAWGCPVETVSLALQALAEDRAYTWEEQRQDLLSRCEHVDPARIDAARAAESVPALFAALAEDEARQLAAAALRAKSVSPFEMKGARQGRIVAERIIEVHGVPEVFRRAFSDLNAWVRNGCPRPTEIQIIGGA